MKTYRLITHDQLLILERNTWSTNMAGMDIYKEDSDE
jgi:hypothetical protein